MIKLLYILTIIICIAGCSEEKATKTKASTTTAKPTYYARNIDYMVRITSYDFYGQKIAEAQGVYISKDVVVTPLAWIKGAFSAKINTMKNRQAFNVFGYVAVDLDEGLVALRVARRQKEALAPIDTTIISSNDTLYTLDYKRNNINKTIVNIVDDGLQTDVAIGAALFDESGNLRGLADKDNHLISSKVVDKLAKNCNEKHENLYSLRLKSNKVYPSYKSISGFRIRTSMGNINIALYNQTPTYRDNFIRLVCDDFYDSLLVHRVLPNYLIQSGAADSRHAKKDDLVGWQGPGYTLPMERAKGLFCKRGAVCASKLPEDHNASNRSDGSQFFIISGRKFSNTDLNEIEKEYHKHFSSAQREAYTTIGGAPYLDGDYTVVGYVTAGMDVVDRIAAVEVDGDRPKRDIRVYDVEIIKR